MNRTFFTKLSLASLLLAGCQNTPTKDIRDAPQDVASPTAMQAKDGQGYNKRKDEHSLDTTFVRAMQSFALTSFQSILHHANEGNINDSSISLYYPLMLSYKGSEGKTKKELRHVLRIGDVTSDVSKQMNNLYQQLFMDNTYGMLKIANSLWFDDQITIYDRFLETASKDFYASTYPCDFAD